MRQGTARDTFRVTLDLTDPDRPDQETGDCVVRPDGLDAPKHEAVPRRPLAAALELYRLSRDEHPAAADARLLRDMGQAVDAYVTRPFESGVPAPSRTARRTRPPTAPHERCHPRGTAEPSPPQQTVRN